MSEQAAATHYVLISESGVYVKEAEFFKSQGGLTQPWGQTWLPIVASSLYDARAKGIVLRREKFPSAHLTQGERCGDNPETYWPEARGQ